MLRSAWDGAGRCLRSPAPQSVEQNNITHWKRELSLSYCPVTWKTIAARQAIANACPGNDLNACLPWKLHCPNYLKLIFVRQHSSSH